LMLAALFLPLSGEAALALPERPVLMALVVAAALTFAIAASVGGSLAVWIGCAGVVCGAATTLALLRDLAIARAQPRQLAMEKFLSALYPDHPYGRILPKQEDLNALTVDQARAFQERNFSAARSHLYVVGKFDEKQVEAAVRAAFSDWKKGTPPPDAKPSPRAQRAVYLVDPGLVVIDVNAAFANGHRSGVLEEELTVTSIIQTLAANLPDILRVKFLVEGKERETLAGHADLSSMYDTIAVSQLVAQMQ